MANVWWKAGKKSAVIRASKSPRLSFKKTTFFEYVMYAGARNKTELCNARFVAPPT